MLWFIIAYAVVLCLYFYTETSGKMYLRAPNKIILASMFLVFAIIQFQNYTFLSHHLLLMVALFLAWMGDVFLLIDLNRGGDFFLCGNIAFAAYYIATLVSGGQDFGAFWWVLIPWIGLLGTFILLAQKFPKVLKLGKMKWPMVLYLASITLHGMLGLALIILLPNTPMALMGLGALLFMISDFILVIDKFVVIGNKWILRANSLFYFAGLLLIVLSIAL
ncbi:MAG: lysoplasmalogenase family protein [Bacilli bacterium]|jgi:uncharacterized membrane protein YhhN